MAALVELLAEPFYILASVHLRFGPRVAIDALSTATKGAVTLLLVSRGAMAPALAFSVAQLLYAAVVLVGYWAYGWAALAAEVRAPWAVALAGAPAARVRAKMWAWRRRVVLIVEPLSRGQRQRVPTRRGC